MIHDLWPILEYISSKENRYKHGQSHVSHTSPLFIEPDEDEHEGKTDLKTHELTRFLESPRLFSWSYKTLLGTCKESEIREFSHTLIPLPRDQP